MNKQDSTDRKRYRDRMIVNKEVSLLIYKVGKFMELPMNKIRTIINLDDEAGNFSKEALVLITKATEFFVQDLAGVCA